MKYAGAVELLQIINYGKLRNDLWRLNIYASTSRILDSVSTIFKEIPFCYAVVAAECLPIIMWKVT